MAVTRTFLNVVLLPLQGAESEPGSETLLQSLQNFFDAERVRDMFLIVLSVAVFLILVWQVLERMLFAPMRMVLVEELRSVRRCGVDLAGLDKELEDLEAAHRSRRDRKRRLYQAMLLLRDSRVAARRKEVADLSGHSLISAASAVKDKLCPPIDTYLTKTSLSDPETVALRQVLVEISREQAAATAIETRLMLRRIRKTHVLVTAGALLLVLLVVLFGNPALVAFGVFGAVVSRMISFFRSSSDDGLKYNWVTLMLAPVVGGLSGFAGVLLIEGLRAWGVLGDVFAGVHFGGESANPATLAAAFLFGFTERLLDSVTGKAVDGLAPIMAEDPAAGGSGGGPRDPAEGGDGTGIPEASATAGGTSTTPAEQKPQTGTPV